MEIALRSMLRMTEEEFCRLLNTDLRTLRRWEAHQTVPQGAALQALAGLEEAIRRHPEKLDFLIDYIRSASAVGGLSYLLVRLFDDQINSPSWWQTSLDAAVLQQLSTPKAP
jgi:transcriptional regulator with XRE-family HTH domain